MCCVSRSCSQPSTSTPTSPQHGHVECRRCHRHVFLPRPRDKNSLKTGAGVDIKPLLCCSFSSPCPGLCAVSTQPPAASLGTISRTQGSNEQCKLYLHKYQYLHIYTAAQYLHICTAACICVVTKEPRQFSRGSAAVRCREHPQQRDCRTMLQRSCCYLQHIHTIHTIYTIYGGWLA